MNRDELDPVDPACRATSARLHAVLDRELPPADLDGDPHVACCSVCRERIRAALALLWYRPAQPAPLPHDLAGSILTTIRTERRATVRRRIFMASGSLAIAASLVVILGFRWSTPQPPTTPQADSAEALPPGHSFEVPRQVPAPPAELPLSDQLARVTDAFRESTRPITDPASSTPTLLGTLASTLTRSVLQPATFKLDPARDTLAELPEAARVGFEPVTGTAKKGFNRLMREVNAFQPGGAN